MSLNRGGVPPTHARRKPRFAEVSHGRGEARAGLRHGLMSPGRGISAAPLGKLNRGLRRARKRHWLPSALLCDARLGKPSRWKSGSLAYRVDLTSARSASARNSSPPLPNAGICSELSVRLGGGHLRCIGCSSRHKATPGACLMQASPQPFVSLYRSTIVSPIQARPTDGEARMETGISNRCATAIRTMRHHKRRT